MVLNYDITELQQIAEKLSEAFTHKIILFYGDMGAGKTTLIKALCKTWKVEDTPSSPTFSLINEYQLKDQVVYHFDFYRLETESEAWDIGVESYFESGNICLVEWPERVPSFLPNKYHRIEIRILNENTRSLTLTTVS